MKRIFTLLPIFLLITLFGCKNDIIGQVSGEGPRVSEELDLDSFTGVVNAISGDITIVSGNTQKVTIDAQKNIIENLKLNVKEGILYIGYKENVRRAEKPILKIVLPVFDFASVAGSGNMDINGFGKIDDLHLRVTGSGNIDFDGTADRVRVNLTGSGRANLNGEADNGEIRITGSGKFNGEKFPMNNATANLTGSGNAHINCTDQLSGRITGSGNVIGYGDPKVKMKITGSGKYRDES
ncbi:MAG: DUF2807 domain-containing protein [Saprospiraceae bacterium]|nr:DUF2807 domain-containing protein [Saprospiraceae bacterium]